MEESRQAEDGGRKQAEGRRVSALSADGEEIAPPPELVSLDDDPSLGKGRGSWAGEEEYHDQQHATVPEFGETVLDRVESSFSQKSSPWQIPQAAAGAAHMSNTGPRGGAATRSSAEDPEELEPWWRSPRNPDEIPTARRLNEHLEKHGALEDRLIWTESAADLPDEWLSSLPLPFLEGYDHPSFLEHRGPAR